MSPESGAIGGGSSVHAAMEQAAKTRENLINAFLVDSEADAPTALISDAARYNLEQAEKKQKTLNERQKTVDRKETTEKKDDLEPSAVQKIRTSAEKTEKKNPELKQKMLELLRSHINPDDNKDDILEKVTKFYGDISNADDALDFLLETTGGELREQVRKAKEDINHPDRFQREIVAGRNISEEARAFAKEGLGSPTALRDIYRDLINNHRDPRTQFDVLSKQFEYKKLQKAIKFLFNSIGRDLRSQGPSISRGLLHRLFTETRTLQMILGVYHYFKGRMGLLQSLFTKNELTMNSQLTFENLAKEFMNLTGERYPSGDGVLRLARNFHIDNSLSAKIFVFTQMRDAVNAVAGDKIYRSVQHRHEVYAAIIEALEELEDNLEIEEENKEAQEKYGGDDGLGDSSYEEIGEEDDLDLFEIEDEGSF